MLAGTQRMGCSLYLIWVPTHTRLTYSQSLQRLGSPVRPHRAARAFYARRSEHVSCKTCSGVFSEPSRSPLWAPCLAPRLRFWSDGPLSRRGQKPPNGTPAVRLRSPAPAAFLKSPPNRRRGACAGIRRCSLYHPERVAKVGGRGLKSDSVWVYAAGGVDMATKASVMGALPSPHRRRPFADCLWAIGVLVS